MNEAKNAGLPPTGMSGRFDMRAPDEVSAMLALKSCGWGTKRIAAELGCSRNTVKRWIAEGGWREMAPVSRRKSLDGLEDWVAGRFRQHAGNADVVRQELAAEKDVVVSLRTVERAVAHLRQALRAEAVAARCLTFDRQVAEFQICIAVLDGYTALGNPVTKVAGQVCPGTEAVRPSAELCNTAPAE